MKKIFKQKLVLLFLLIVGIAVVVNSCQQDDFLSEQEKFSKYVKQEKFAFNYLSQDIQDKLDAVSLGFNSKNNDSITAGLQLVTDSAVVFTHIPTGKKYYTFVVKRLPSNGKLENLVLVENGASFDEYLVQYNNSTPSNQDKATMHKLQNGVYNNLANKRQDCQDVTVWVSCSENVHNENNLDSWHECVATQPPYVYTYLFCREVSDDYQSHNNGNGFSNGGGGDENIGITPFPIETEPPLVVTFPLDDVSQEDLFDEKLTQLFGEDNWEPNSQITEENAAIVLNSLSELDDVYNDYGTTLTETSNADEQVGNSRLISKTIEIKDDWYNAIDIDITCNYNKTTKEATNIASEETGFVALMEWNQTGSNSTIVRADNPATQNDESITKVTVEGQWSLCVFFGGIGRVIKKKYKIWFLIYGSGGSSSPQLEYIPNE